MGEDARWVRESRFGTWFLGTATWRDRVLAVSMEELVRCLGPDRGPFPRVLDAGSGEGPALPMLAERFDAETLLGVDIDPALVSRARSQAAACPCDAEVQEADVGNLPVASESFDLVLCHQTLHHVSDPERALREFQRVLRPGGVLLLAEACRRFIHSIPVRVLFRHPMEMQRDAPGYLELLRRTGFAFEPENVAFGEPWWSRPDLGLRERLGLGVASEAEPTLVHVAATRVG